ncbi:MAG: [citrate (pro-3S)-lyase] ligase [Ruminococcaceae bacterium]|nr:[citrate (pro-3S)-lyase] ligase [Oscillospiraceae bacterium]
MSDVLTAISPRDARAMAQVDALLQQEGIRRDRNLDYTCAVFDEDGRAVATGSAFDSTIRCLAVDGGRQGEGLLNQVVSHLMEVQAARGNTHVFLYTKVKNTRFFADLGFYEIARADGEAVFMENRRTGFADYCRALARSRRPGVSAAVVMHANPFTLGHLHLVDRAAAESDFVHLFVLSEESGPIPFAVRRQLVHRGVAHLPNVICHDSGPYIISSATFPSYFLPDEDAVIAAHARLDLAVFGQIAAALGVTRRYVGAEPASRVTAGYNRIMAERLPELGIECRVIPRLEENGRAISASTVRQAIHDGELAAVADMLPDATLRYFTSPEAAGVIRAIQAANDVRHY